MSETLIEHPNKILTTKLDYCTVLPTPELVEDMRQLMIQKKGVGLAANQVGINQAYFIANFSFGFTVCINPRITRHGKDEIEEPEGCLSILKDGKPNFLPKKRWAIVDVSYMTPDGQVHNQTLKRKDARIFQHEMDHIEGRLCQ